MNCARSCGNLLNFVRVMPKILLVPFFSGHGVDIGNVRNMHEKLSSNSKLTHSSKCTDKRQLCTCTCMQQQRTGAALKSICAHASACSKCGPAKNSNAQDNDTKSTRKCAVVSTCRSTPAFTHPNPNRNWNRNPDLNLDLLTSGSMHAEDLPWNLGSIEFPVDSSSRFLFTARTDRQTRRHTDIYSVQTYRC